MFGTSGTGLLCDGSNTFAAVLVGEFPHRLLDQLLISVLSNGPMGTVNSRCTLLLRLLPRTEQQERNDAGLMQECTDPSGVPADGVRMRLRLRVAVASTGPRATVSGREDRTEDTECTEGVRVPSERLRCPRSSVAKTGPLGTVQCAEECTDFSGVAPGVGLSTEQLRLRPRIAVASNGPFGTVNLARDGVRLLERAECTDRDRAERERRSGFSGVPAKGVRPPTEWLRLRPSVASLGP